jgi:hypothetical protein
MIQRQQKITSCLVFSGSPVSTIIELAHRHIGAALQKDMAYMPDDIDAISVGCG